ncbi:hypothetical protein C8R47DRAFT_1295054 [Mycena vitilis]|nr:hypothetical protein C8R47DRAFT_1295054 [Mycena vitilis]
MPILVSLDSTLPPTPSEAELKGLFFETGPIQGPPPSLLDAVTLPRPEAVGKFAERFLLHEFIAFLERVDKCLQAAVDTPYISINARSMMYPLWLSLPAEGDWARMAEFSGGGTLALYIPMTRTTKTAKMTRTHADLRKQFADVSGIKSAFRVLWKQQGQTDAAMRAVAEDWEIHVPTMFERLGQFLTSSTISTLPYAEL